MLASVLDRTTAQLEHGMSVEVSLDTVQRVAQIRSLRHYRYLEALFEHPFPYVVYYRENRLAIDVHKKLRNAGKHGRQAAALVHGHDGEGREREKSALVPLAALDPLAGQFHLFLTSGKTARNKHYAFNYFTIMAIICQVGKLPLFQGQHRS